MPGWLHVPLATALAPLLGAMAVLAWRIRETQRPVSRRSIVLPPLAMSTGLMIVRWRTWMLAEYSRLAGEPRLAEVVVSAE